MMTEVGTLDGFRGLAMPSEQLLGLTKLPEKSRVGVDGVRLSQSCLGRIT